MKQLLFVSKLNALYITFHKFHGKTNNSVMQNYDEISCLGPREQKYMSSFAVYLSKNWFSLDYFQIQCR